MNHAFVGVVTAVTAAFGLVGSARGQLVEGDAFVNVSYHTAGGDVSGNDRQNFAGFGNGVFLDRTVSAPGLGATAQATVATRPGALGFRLSGGSEITSGAAGTQTLAEAGGSIVLSDRVGFYSASQPLGAPLSLHLSVVGGGTTHAVLQPAPPPGSHTSEADPDAVAGSLTGYTLSSGARFTLGEIGSDFRETHVSRFDQVDSLFDYHVVSATPGGLGMDIVVPNDPSVLYPLHFYVLGYAGLTLQHVENDNLSIIGHFDLDFTNILVWDGVTSARVDDVVVSDLSVFSESGFDYNRSYVLNAVPEPSTYGWAAATGLVVLIVGRRRRQ